MRDVDIIIGQVSFFSTATNCSVGRCWEYKLPYPKIPTLAAGRGCRSRHALYSVLVELPSSASQVAQVSDLLDGCSGLLKAVCCKSATPSRQAPKKDASQLGQAVDSRLFFSMVNCWVRSKSGESIGCWTFCILHQRSDGSDAGGRAIGQPGDGLRQEAARRELEEYTTASK